jgi:hypothetical protein
MGSDWNPTSSGIAVDSVGKTVTAVAVARGTCGVKPQARARYDLIHLGVGHNAALKVFRERRAGNGNGDCYN